MSVTDYFCCFVAKITKNRKQTIMNQKMIDLFKSLSLAEDRYNGKLNIETRILQNVKPQKSLTYKVRKGGFTLVEMRSLGCQIEITSSISHEKDEVVRQCVISDERLRYSFNPDYYHNMKSALFDTELLTRMFNLYPLESYTTPAKLDVDGVLSSNKIITTLSYPVFLFIYENEHGQWARKYEPYLRKEMDGKVSCYSKKLMWLNEHNKKTDGLFQEICGDNDVMRALKTGKVESSDPYGHPLKIIERRKIVGGESIKVHETVFSRIIICSSPNNAINVYFHSDAHVVFPYSDNKELSRSTIDKLLDIANEVFVLYDIDSAGIKAMNKLALHNMKLKVIYLPNDLTKCNNPRTKENCKDAEEFFNFYPSVMSKDEYLQQVNINQYFSDLIKTARSMQFWNVLSQCKKNGEKKYAFNFNNLVQFLSANGFYKYIDKKNAIRYIYIHNNIVDVIEEKQISAKVKEIMHQFLHYNTQYYSEELSNFISMQRIGHNKLSGIREIEPNFCSFGKDFEFFFFKNCAVKVTPNCIKSFGYIDLPFYVNSKAILDFNFYPQSTPFFTIQDNPEYRVWEELNSIKREDKKLTETGQQQINAEFAFSQHMYRYQLKFPKEIEKMPICIQFLYDIGRMYWRKEALGMKLTKEEKQCQDMHFVSKVALIGYMLSSYHTQTTIPIAIVTGNSLADDSVDRFSTGTGKSLFLSYFDFVRKVYRASSLSFDKKTKSNFRTNYLRTGGNSLCIIDDCSEDLKEKDFNDIVKKIRKKTLFHDEIFLSKDFQPKVLMVIKQSFDISKYFMSDRIMFAMFSDYYHDGNYNNSMTPFKKFGKDIIYEITEEERNEAIYMMLQCCQFYIGLQDCIIPPIEVSCQNKDIYSVFKDEVFVNWANCFFASEWHWKRPISVQDMVISLLKYRNNPISKQNIKATRKEMLEKINIYCNHMQYIKNPPIVFGKDKSSNEPRRYAWETEFIDDTNYRKERVRKSTRVCYFYKLGEEPKDSSEILSCPNTDKEMEANYL